MPSHYDKEDNSNSVKVEFETGLRDAAVEEDALFQEMSPTGEFTEDALETLVRQLNTVLPAFGLSDPFPLPPEGVHDRLPQELVRLLSMVQQAVSDAIAADVVSEDLAFDLAEVSSDADLKLIAGKLNRLGKDKKFQKFLTEAQPEEELPAAEEEMVVEEEPEGPELDVEEASEEDLDKLFASRL